MMEKTIKINLGGILFLIDEEAYHLLRDYLKAIDNRFKNVPGGIETVEDIESRIAEIFQSHKGLSGIISRENVEAMISIIGKPGDFDQPENQQEPRISTHYRRRLYRNQDDSIISGVCGGIGAYLNMDPVWIRIIFILFSFGFGIGFFVYVALWIALPKAITDIQKRELYGDYYNYSSYRSDASLKTNTEFSPDYLQREDSVSRVGGAFNEVFRAIGKFFFIFFRIVMILIGVTFVIAGFTTIIAFIMVFFFRYPGFISMGSLNNNLFYLPDFLGHIVSPAITPWIMILTFIAIALPLFALVYWGTKMIFWFRAKDGIISLIFLIIWVMSLTSLAIILFNEGVSFSETGRASSQVILENRPDTLYIITDKKVKDLPFRKEFSLPDDDYTVFLVDSSDQLFIRARLRLNIAEDNLVKVEIRKRSSGRLRTDAVRKAESLIYQYRISNDTLYLDEYFTIPSGNKWSGDDLSVNLYLPANTILYFDNTSENLFHERIIIGKVEDNIVTDSKFDYDTEPWELGNKYWIISDDGLKATERAPVKNK
jgi:phage shock protein PspC (stress-responsive transcriptional regulator)